MTEEMKTTVKTRMYSFVVGTIKKQERFGSNSETQATRRLLAVRLLGDLLTTVFFRGDFLFAGDLFLFFAGFFFLDAPPLCDLIFAIAVLATDRLGSLCKWGRCCL